MYDVCIIGGGVVGGLIARKLCSYELKICILEKENDVATGSTKANSAIVHAGFDALTGTMKAKLNVEGSEMMPKITEELGVKYINNGSVVIAFNDEEKDMLNILYKRGTSNRVKGLELLTKEEILLKEPNLSENVVAALYAPTGSIICPYELCIAAIGNAMDNGVELKLNFNVDKIDNEDNHFDIYCKNEKIQSKYLINSAGVYSDYIASLLGINFFKITPRKGEYILLDKECGQVVKSTVFRTPSKAGKGILVSPTVDGNLILGPTSEEIKDKDDKSTTANGISKIIDEEKGNLKKLMLNKSITSFCGLRAAGSTDDFIINRTGNFICLGAIESPGLSASPAIAEYVAKLLGEVCEFKENRSYNPVRKPSHFFKNLSDEEKNNVIKENPSYGKIICRCENITEGEILDALRSEPKAHDLDGIKRRTRAQMGRCQGGFCTPYIMDIMTKELGCSFDELTKSGGESFVTMGKTKGE